MRAWRAAAGLALLLTWMAPAGAQEDEVERPGPPKLEDFEADANEDGLPDGWYNPRDAKLVKGDGVVGPTYLHFEAEKPSRPARLSRAFGINGREVEAIVIGAWVRGTGLQTGERLGDEPGLAIDLLGPGLRTVSRGMFGPWTRSIGPRWIHVAKRIPVPPETLDALMTVGLNGGTGVLEVDGMTFDLIPVGGSATTNLIVNGDFELGDPDPFGWIVDHGAHRVSPGYRSDGALELVRSGERALVGVAVPVDRVGGLELSMAVRASGLRGAGGAVAGFYFLDADGRLLPGLETGLPLFRWSGSFEWRAERIPVNVPEAAVRAVLQVQKNDASGWLRIDDVKVVASPDPEKGTWEPYHVQTDTSGWKPVSPSPTIVAGSALDASFLLGGPAGHRGFVGVREGRLAFTRPGGGRARFFGVQLIAPTAFQDPARADALADHLARSGINLVRLGDLDTPVGPSRSLLDDTRDDTRSLDPIALARLDHLIAALKARGIYVAIELQAERRYREGDQVPGYRDLLPGGGPAAAFDPTLRARELEVAKALLTHVNPETGLALVDDPVLAWVTLAGELSLFDKVEPPDPRALPPESEKVLKDLARRTTAGTGARFWQATESAQWVALANDLRKLKLRVPIAGDSHWRHEPPEFNAAQAAAGLDLVDDRLYWNPPNWGLPDRRSLLRVLTGGLVAEANKKRHRDRPYVVGQWCDRTSGAWALPYEGADLMLAAEAASVEDWDALVRRGVFLYPESWGSGATGTGGVDDFYVIPEMVNGIPQVFALLPHAASLYLRGQNPPGRGRAASKPARVHGLPGPDPRRGRLVIHTPYTQGLAGWSAREPVDFEELSVEVDTPYAVVVATSMGREPIAQARRLLVTAVARVEPTGFRWVDEFRNDVAAPGVPPLLREPVVAKVTWRHKGPVTAYALDNTGARVGPVALAKEGEGVRLDIDGSTATFHWELVAEPPK